MISNDLQKALNKVAGEGSVVRASEAKALEYERLPTGSVRLDAALGGGLPMGRIVEWYGLESHGKTSTLLKAIASIQKQGRVCALLCSEEFDAAWAAKLGVDLDALELARPDSAEQMINLAEVMIRSREVSFLAIDSITGFVPLHVLGRGADEPTQGVEAKLNNLFARKVLSAMAPGDLRDPGNRGWCCVAYVNQLRAKMGGPYAFNDVGGGMGLRFFKSVSVEFKRKAFLSADGGELQTLKERSTAKAGIRVAFVTRKNKTAIPFGAGEVDLYFADGRAPAGSYDLTKDLVIAGLDCGAIEQHGSMYHVGGRKFRGREALVEALRTDAEALDGVSRELSTAHRYLKVVRKRRG